MTDAAEFIRLRIALASELAAAYVSRNAVPAVELPGLIISLGTALDRLAKGATTSQGSEYDKATPPAIGPNEIRRSITRDALISFLDGKPYKTLKRHVGTHGLTPEGYRVRFGLPSDYPMVAPSYSERRSAIANSIGLGAASGPRAKPAKG